MNAFIQAIIGSAIAGIGFSVMIFGFLISLFGYEIFPGITIKNRIVLASIFFALAFIVTLGFTGLKAINDWAKESISHDQHQK